MSSGGLREETRNDNPIAVFVKVGPSSRIVLLRKIASTLDLLRTLREPGIQPGVNTNSYRCENQCGAAACGLAPGTQGSNAAQKK